MLLLSHRQEAAGSRQRQQAADKRQRQRQRQQAPGWRQEAEEASNRQAAARSRQQAGGRQAAAGSKQAGGSRQQAAGRQQAGSRQAAGRRQQAASSRQAAASSRQERPEGCVRLLAACGGLLREAAGCVWLQAARAAAGCVRRRAAGCLQLRAVRGDRQRPPKARASSSGCTRVGGTGAGGASSGGAGAGGAGVVGASTEETGAGGMTTAAPDAPPHRYDTRLQALRWLEREERERLEQERQELHELDQQQLFPPVSGLWALGLPSSPPVHSQSPTAYGPTFPPLDTTPAVFSPPQSQSSPTVVMHDWTSRCPPRARPSSPLADLRTVSRASTGEQSEAY
ncbi:unnamed protein product [Closterium sp. NIES-54]